MHIAAAQFKAKCLSLMDQVAQTGEPVVITKHGQAVAQLVPADTGSAPLLGYLAGSVTVNGDIVAGLDEPWSADA